MKCLNAKVYHNPAYANPPTLQLLVDHLSANDAFRFREAPTHHGTAYYAEAEGEVRFYFHDPNNQNGYGGSTFHLTMEDGEARDIRGPWSSRPGAIDPIFGTSSMDVSLTDKEESFNRGYTFYAGHCTLDFAQAAVDRFLPDWKIVKIEDREVHYQVQPSIPTGASK